LGAAELSAMLETPSVAGAVVKNPSKASAAADVAATIGSGDLRFSLFDSALVAALNNMLFK
jgi:hypothetical protein